MYVCESCEKTFEYPNHKKICVGEFWGMPAYETWACCPYCGSTDLEERVEYDEYEEEEYDN